MRHPFPKYDCPTTPRGILHLEPKQARERDLLHHETTNIADRLSDRYEERVSVGGFGSGGLGGSRQQRGRGLAGLEDETASSGHEEGGGWNKRDLSGRFGVFSRHLANHTIACFRAIDSTTTPLSNSLAHFADRSPFARMGENCLVLGMQGRRSNDRQASILLHRLHLTCSHISPGQVEFTIEAKCVHRLMNPRSWILSSALLRVPWLFPNILRIIALRLLDLSST